jgi:arylsulfatase A-like enzyme
VPAAPSTRPNVLFITADQWRAECLSALGHPCVRTPHLDALAADGTLFTRHYCQAAPCSPSRASLYTGLYQMTHRVVQNGSPLDDRFANLAREARQAGYDPTLFGYTDQSADPRTLEPGDPRLTTYEGVLPGFAEGLKLDEAFLPWRDWLADQGVAGAHDGDAAFHPADWDGTRHRLGPGRASPRFSREQTQAAMLVGRFLDWLKPRVGLPWFAHVSFLSPHPPFVVPAPYNTMVQPEATPRPVRRQGTAAESAQHPFLAHVLRSGRRENYVPAPEPGLVADWDESEVAVLRAVYYGMIAEVDAQVGRLVDGLKAAGVYDDTIVVFASDHGEMLGDHYMFGKRGYFDQAFHVPLIVRAPGTGLGRGAIVRRFTENVDVMPTILDLLGRPVPAQCDGRPLTAFLRGAEPADWRTEAHWEFDFREVETAAAGQALGLPLDACQLAVLRGERYKYVHFTALPPLLFDLQRDPGEFDNRAEDPDYREVALDCARRMLSWRLRHADRTLTGIALLPGGPYLRDTTAR